MDIPDLDAPSRACLAQFDAARARRAGATDPSRAPAFCRELSAWIDGYFEARIASIFPGTTTAVLAVGGYGRRELGLASDIDILLLCPPDSPKAAEIAGPLLHPLWDAKLDVGHAVRTLEECLAWASSDPSVFAALLDRRYVAGREALARELDTHLLALTRRRGREVFEWLRTQRLERAALHGDASQELEPDCKYGLGGLRDYHLCHWTGLLFEDSETALPPAIIEGRDFLLAARNAVTLCDGRPRDTIPLDLIPPVAEALAGNDIQEGISPVERFYARFQDHAARLKRYTNHLVLHAADQFPCAASATLTSGGLELLKADLATKRLPSWQTQETLRRDPPQTAKQRRDGADIVLACLQDPDPLPLLEILHETGFLAAIVPPWAQAAHTFALDGSHRYPTGWHSLHSVGALAELSRGEATVFGDPGYETLAKTPVLRLAALVHDIGKGRSDHAHAGARLFQPFLDLFALTEKEKRLLRFLIENHLLLSTTATRRDLQEEETVLAFANQVGHPATLHALLLLTWADSQASGSAGWTPWVASLINELVTKTSRLLASGEFADGHHARRLSRIRDQLRSRMPWPCSAEHKENLLQRLGSRYLLQHDIDNVLEHLDMYRAATEKALRGPVVRAWRRQGVDGWRIAALCLKGDRLFSALAGVLTRHQVNIRSGTLHRWLDGTIVVSLHTDEPPDPLYPEKYWQRVRSDLEAVFSARLALEYQLARVVPGFETPPGCAVQLRLDNAGSDFFTVIEIAAPDQAGLLYRIVHALEELKLEVAWASVHTVSHHVTDTFYVRDQWGEKLTAAEQEQTVRQALDHCLKPT